MLVKSLSKRGREDKIKKLQAQKNEAVKRQDFVKAKEIFEKVIELRNTGISH